MNKRKFQIAIIGYAGLDEYPDNVRIDPMVYKYAYDLGRMIGQKGWIVITGGKTGVMQQANKGCKETGGISVGVIKGEERFKANKYVDIEVLPGTYTCGEEMTLIAMSDVVIMLGGGVGTLQELTIAYRMSKPIYSIRGLGGWSERLSKFDALDERNIKAIKYFDNPSVLFRSLVKNMEKIN